MSEHVLFVGDLAPEIDEPYLMSFFSQYYSTVRSVAVMNKGFGYVRFSSEADRDRSIQEMQGVMLGSRAIRVSAAAPKGGPSGALPPGGGAGRGREPSGPDDPNNTTLFVGGLNSMISEDQLRSVFEAYGGVAYARIPPGKGCGFVQFLERAPAERALNELNGGYVGSCAMRITWGKSTKPIGSIGGGGGGGGGGGYHAPPSYPPAPSHHSYGSYGGGYPPAYPGYSSGYDAYGGAYGSHAAYDAYYAGYNQGSYPAGSAPGGSAERAERAPAASPAAATQTTPSSDTYDPLAPVSVDRLNAAYMKRLTPVLSGSFMRVGA